MNKGINFIYLVTFVDSEEAIRKSFSRASSASLFSCNSLKFVTRVFVRAICGEKRCVNLSCALPPFSEGILPDEDSCTQLWQLLGKVPADRNRPRGDREEPGSHSGAGARREDRISRFHRFLYDPGAFPALQQADFIAQGGALDGL